MVHGKTVKYCYSCQAPRSHLILEQGSLKGYLCERYETHGTNIGRTKEDLPSLSSTHTGTCTTIGCQHHFKGERNAHN